MKDSVLKFKYKFLERLSPSRSPQITPMYNKKNHNKLLYAINMHTRKVLKSYT